MPGFGYKATPEHRANISRALTGRTLSPEHRANLSIANGGENHPNYGKKRPKHRAGMIAEKNPNWAGGSYIVKGYRFIWVGEGDGKNHHTRYKMEHVLKAEKALGRPLKAGEIVHHINGDKLDNRNSNLLICSPKYHAWLHSKMSQLYMQEQFGGAQ